MTSTNSDFKSFLPNFSPKPAETVVSGVPAPEPLSSTPASSKTQAGEAHSWNLVAPVVVERLVNAVCKLHAAAKGSTVSLADGNMVGRKLFAVSIYPERSVERPSPPTRQNIFAFAFLHMDVLVKPGRAVGSWFDRLRNVHVLDVVVCLPDRRTAINLGRFFGQALVYDLFFRREIVIRLPRIHRVRYQRIVSSNSSRGSLRGVPRSRKAKAVVR